MTVTLKCIWAQTKKFEQAVVKQNYWLVFPETDNNDMMQAFNEEHSVQQM